MADNNRRNCFQKIFGACCPSSVRWLILLLSFGALSSLFANLQLFNLVILYIDSDQQQQMLMPNELNGAGTFSIARSSSVGTVNWASSTLHDTNLTSNESKTISTGTMTTKTISTSTPQMRNGDEADETIFPNDTESTTVATIATTKMVPSKRKLRLKGRKEKVKDKRMVKTYADVENDEQSSITMEDEVFNTVKQAQQVEKGDQPTVTELWAHAKIQRLAQSLLFSAPGMAILIAHFPSYVLIRRYGSHKPLLCVLLISAATTGAFPFIINFESPLPFIMLARILLALCVAPAFSFLGQMAARWATTGEQFIFILIGILAIHFGPMISWFTTVKLLRFDHSSRLQVFGLHSGVCFILALLWFIFYRDQPQKHQLVNGEELNYIVKRKPRSSHPLRLPTSLFCLLLRSTSAWACWIAAFCYFYALLSMLIFYPIFLHKVLRQTVESSIITPLGMLLIAHLLFHLFFTCSPAAVQRQATWKVRFFNSFGFLLSALIFIGIAILPRNNELYATRHIWLLWFCLLPLGATSLGFIKSAVVTGGGFFTQYIVSHMQLGYALAYAIVPTLLYSSMAEGSIVHWRLLFLSTSLVLLLGMTIFIILGRGTPTSWAEQWSEDAQADAPLLLIKFSPVHRPPSAQQQPSRDEE